MHHRVPRAGLARPSVASLLRYLPAWLASMRAAEHGADPMSDALPWLTFAATAELSRIVSPTSRVFEYGAGGSTLFFAERAAFLASVEHNEDWYGRVARRLDGFDNVEFILSPPEDDASGQSNGEYGSGDPGYQGMTFADYAASIDRFPDSSFDVLLIDGRARPACFRHGHRKVRPGGCIVIDDSERPRYSSIEDLALEAGWSAQRFFGPGPYTRTFWETTIWTKTSEPRDASSG